MNYEIKDIGNVINLLCKQIQLLTNVNFTSDHFRRSLPKENKSDKSSQQPQQHENHWWPVLKYFSHHTLKNMARVVDLELDDVIVSTKMNFALLGYKSIEFYSMSDTDDDNYLLLLAFVWLIKKYKSLDIIVKNYFDSCIYDEVYQCEHGEDCSVSIPLHSFDSVDDKVNSIIHKNLLFNYNLKRNIELIDRKIRLVRKLKMMQLKSHFLPLILSIKNDNPFENQKVFAIYQNSALLYKFYREWKSKEILFWYWMGSNVAKFRSQSSIERGGVDKTHFQEFTSILHEFTKKNIDLQLKNNDILLQLEKYHCPPMCNNAKLLNLDTFISSGRLHLKDINDESKIDELKNELQSISNNRHF